MTKNKKPKKPAPTSSDPPKDPPAQYPPSEERWIGLTEMLTPQELEELRRKSDEDIEYLKKVYPGLKTN